jgi:hypothetical protein
MPAASADEAKTKALQEDLEQVKKAIAESKLLVITDALKAKAKSIEEKLALQPSKSSKTGPLRNKAALTRIKMDLEVSMSERQARLEAHADKAKERSEKFKADIAEHTARLKQLEEQYEREAVQKLEEWRVFNLKMDKHNAEVKGLVEKRLSELASVPDADLEADSGADQAKTNAPAASTVAQSVVQAANQGDLAAMHMMKQLEHRNPNIEATDLPDVKTLATQEQLLGVLAQLWEWSQGLLLEDQQAVVSFGQSGVEAKVFPELLGQKVWDAIFSASPGWEDVIPYQVRQLIDYQLRAISHLLTTEAHQESREKGKECSKKAIKKVRADSIAMKKGISAPTAPGVKKESALK